VLDADVGEVHVAVDDEGDHVADLAAPQLVGDERERLEVAAAGDGEDEAVLDGHLVAVEGAGEDAPGVARHPVEGGNEATSVASAHGCP